MPSTLIQQKIEELREEWDQVFPRISGTNEVFKDKIYNYFISKFNQYRQELIQEISREKEEYLKEPAKYNIQEYDEIYDDGFNQGLQSAIDIINKEK